MRLYFSKKQGIILGSAALVMVLFIIFAQASYLSPLKSDLQTKKQTLATDQKLLEIASQKKKQDNQQTVLDTRELQKKLPVKPMQEQLILDLEKAETVSHSQIKSMGFSKDIDVAVANAQATTQTQAAQQTADSKQSNTSQNANQTSAANEPNQDQSTASQTAGSSAPAMKKITVSLAVESPNYEDLEKFIQTLESLQRIVVVESINYSSGKEVTTAADATSSIGYSLTVSAFYMPSLTDLAAQLPKVNAPAPAGKENPLPQYPQLTQNTP